MFEADIAGKLPEFADYEDYLTSCVFGALKYLPPNKGLLPVLAAAKNHRLDISLGHYCERESIQLKAVTEAQFIFWPTSSKYGKPDLVAILRGAARSFVIPIEVKYFAGKHGEEEHDQLGRYYEALSTPSARTTFSDSLIRQFSGELLAVVYVTQFAATHEIEATLHQLESEGRTDAQKRVFHLKWQQVYRVIQDQSLREHDPLHRRVLVDIERLLAHRHLKPFAGFRGLEPELSADARRRFPVFFESEEYQAREFCGFPTLPSPLSPRVLSRRSVFFGT